MQCYVIAASCVATHGAVRLGTERHGEDTASPLAAQRVLGREAFRVRLPSNAVAYSNNVLTCHNIKSEQK
jgi:hypothetical protein